MLTRLFKGEMARDLKGLLKFCFKSGVLLYRYVVENIAQRMRGKGKMKKKCLEEEKLTF